MSGKKFVPCLYLYQGKAVTSFADRTPISLNPVELAAFYDKAPSDALLVFDLSHTDEEHEESLGLIRQICDACKLPVTGAGHVNRLEDIKKLLYGGCARAALNFDKAENIALAEEASARFGKERLVAAVNTAEQISDNEKLLGESVCEIINMNPLLFKEVLQISPVPVLSMMPEVALDKIIGILKQDNLSGLTGQLINENVEELASLKRVCAENGIQTGSGGQSPYAWKDFTKNSDGLMPVVVQDNETEQVLMVAYMNEEAYLATLSTGLMTYFSRSRQQLWIKGESSGHYQHMISLTADCDLDTLLARVKQEGVACHTGRYSCFFHDIVSQSGRREYNPLKVLQEVYSVIEDRKAHPKEGSYTNYLFDKGLDKILKKLGEEATEIVIAAKNPDTHEVVYEISDFLYHLMVLMQEKGISWDMITQELAKR